MKLITRIKNTISKSKKEQKHPDSADVYETKPRRNWVIYLKEPHQYTKYNMEFEEAQSKHPKSIRTLAKGKIIWAQDKPFSQAQIEEVNEKGFHYQWGFGPCYEKIPSHKVKFSQLTQI